MHILCEDIIVVYLYNVKDGGGITTSLSSKAKFQNKSAPNKVFSSSK